MWNKHLWLFIAIIVPICTYGQLKVTACSKAGFPDCLFRRPFDENVFNSQHIYVSIHEENTDSTNTFKALIMLHELYVIMHNSRRIDACSFRELISYYLWNDLAIDVSKEEFDILRSFKYNANQCSLIDKMNFDQFINHYFIKDKESGGIHLRNTNLSANEEQCIYMRLFNERVTSMSGFESADIVIPERPCYFD